MRFCFEAASTSKTEFPWQIAPQKVPDTVTLTNLDRTTGRACRKFPPGHCLHRDGPPSLRSTWTQSSTSLSAPASSSCRFWHGVESPQTNRAGSGGKAPSEPLKVWPLTQCCFFEFAFYCKTIKDFTWGQINGPSCPLTPHQGWLFSSKANPFKNLFGWFRSWFGWFRSIEPGTNVFFFFLTPTTTLTIPISCHAASSW